jgi:hypothetical protein
MDESASDPTRLSTTRKQIKQAGLVLTTTTTSTTTTMLLRHDDARLPYYTAHNPYTLAVNPDITSRSFSTSLFGHPEGQGGKGLKDPGMERKWKDA